MPSSPQPIRVGAVSYLNTKPLVYNLASIANEIDLSFDLPSRLASRLSNGELDVGLIPSIELLQRDDYSIISDACIACNGPVWSVRLMSRVPLDQIRSVAMDEGSRTSVAMLKILFDQRFGRQPASRQLPIDDDPFECETDAVLIIGDRAMNCKDEAFRFDWDLGQEWYNMTGLPFVFATWTARSNPDISECALQTLERQLEISRDRGIENISTIAETESARFGLTAAQTVNYLKTHLHFRLGAKQCEGLALFREHAVRLGLAPKQVDIKFYECNAS